MRISVVIPVHNRADLIGQTLDAALSQTLVPDEILVIDDGSTDRTPDVVEEYCGKSSGVVRLIRQTNAGPSRARNLGIEKSTGDLIALLDADDLWMPDKLARQRDFLMSDEGRAAPGVYCRMFKFSRSLDDLGREEPQGMIDRPSVEHVVTAMGIQSSTAVVRRSALGSVRFDENLRAAEDAIFFAEVTLKAGADWRMIDAPLVAYRVHEVQLTKGLRHALETTRARIQWCRAMNPLLGDARAKAIEERLASLLIERLEARYWRRELQGLAEMRDELAQLCPAAFERSILSQKRIWPRWLYRVIDPLRG